MMRRQNNPIWKVKLIFSMFLLILCSSAMAQPGTVDEARMYLDMKQYDKAIDAFDNLYKKDNRNQEIYSGYLDALLAAKEYKKAEGLVNAQIQKNPSSAALTVDMGRVYHESGKEKKAEELYEAALTMLNGDDLLTQLIAKKFTDLERDDYALKTYEQAGLILHNQYLYSGPMARLYFKAGDLDNGIATLLNASRSFYNGGIEEVKTTLLDYLGDDRKKLAKAQKAIIKKINEEPDNPYYSELLTWLYTQKDDWDGALIQVRALDERYKEQGERILDFARYAVKENKNEFALKAYSEVLDKGKEYPFYSTVIHEMLGVKFKILQDKSSFTPEEVNKLADEYKQFLDSFPDYYTFHITQDYATVLARYAGQPEQAIALLEKVIALPAARRDFVGQCKLQLGDYMILVGRIWDASLTYTQVQKEFREDVLGEEARFRDAKLAYFRGDFEWANIQASVLKASTSELIANDALYLSVLITENIPPDSNYVPLERFAYADLLVFQNKYDEAEHILDSISTAFPDHPLADDLLMQRAKIAQKKRDYTKALAYLEKIHQEHGKDVLADDALFTMAEINEKYLDKKEEAGRLYAQLIIEYPGSTYIQLARKKVNELGASISL
ncbi:MAG: tetratricopeptide repeat protein [Chitinophagaceae bacterium]|nr:tetratricopeptide repeat protein [Chitinophagaceae bacterium]